MRRRHSSFPSIDVKYGGCWVILTGLFLTLCPAAEPGKPSREVFPVPSVIAGIFRSGGLTAFDPFTTWEPGSAEPPASLIPAAPGTDADLLPEGLCYDVMPVWQARGFQPRVGTRVLYHPGSRLLFTTIAAGDEAEVREYCQWPAGIWLGDSHWRGSSPHQLQARITTWAVPAAGPGGWQFRPERPEDFMALPAEARRLVGRQTFAIRGGQKSKAEAITRPRLTNNETGPGMVTEMECALADDGETVDFNVAVNYLTGRGTAQLSDASIAFQQIAKLGESWVVEGGCLPGNPPERLFLIFDSYPVEQGATELVEQEKVESKWTRQPEVEAVSVDGMSGRVLDRYEIENLAERRHEAALPKPVEVDKDPFKSGPPGQAWTPYDPLPGLDGKSGPSVTVPALFGETKMSDVTPILERFFGLVAGNIQAWVQQHGLFSSRYVFVRGNRDALQAMEEQMAWFDPNQYANSAVTLTADITFARAMPGTPPDQTEIFWRGRVPVRGGQASALKNQSWPDLEEGAKPAAGGWDLKIDALGNGAPPAAPFTIPLDSHLWNLEISGSLRPTLADNAINLSFLTKDGTPDGASLRRVVGKMKDGREVVLIASLTPDVRRKESPRKRLRLSERRLGSGNMAWWWLRQVADAVPE